MVRKAGVILAHSLLLLVLHLVYFNLNWSLPLEYEMMMMLNKTESFIGGHGRFEKKDYLFINTAYDQVLTNAETEYLDSGTFAITNREMLAKFFEKMKEYGNQHQYILCDIFFDKPSSADSLLNNAIKNIPRIIAPSEYDPEKKQLIEPLIGVKSGQADYITYEGLVSKVRLYAAETHKKTLPLMIYEEQNDVSVKVTKLGLFCKNNYMLRSVYPRYFFDMDVMKQHEMRLKHAVDILCQNGKTFYENAIKDKFIVIGNFSSDTHNTFVGSMPGSLVLFNTYLTLQEGYHTLGIWWVLFALVAFAGLCYYELYYKKARPQRINRSWRKIFIHLLGITSLCMIVSILSGVLFGVHITIIPIIIYLELIRNLKKIVHLKTATK